MRGRNSESVIHGAEAKLRRDAATRVAKAAAVVVFANRWKDNLTSKKNLREADSSRPSVLDSSRSSDTQSKERGSAQTELEDLLAETARLQAVGDERRAQEEAGVL
jgi:hypothetical protein